MNKLVLLIALVLSPTFAVAKIASQGSAFSPEKGLDVSQAFEAQRNAIIKALGDGQRVTTSLDRIAGLLGGVQNVDQLAVDTRVEVFNEQELVNTLLTEAREDSRQVCTREKKVGSHRTTTMCKTVAERRRDMEQSQGALRTNMRVVCVPGVSCPGT